MTDTVSSMPFGHAVKDQNPRPMTREPNPNIHDPNSPEMTAMIKSMLLDQKREERQRRLPELSPPERHVAPSVSEEENSDRLTKLDISRLVPTMPALRSRRTRPLEEAELNAATPELDEEVELLSRQALEPEPDDIITKEDVADMIKKDKIARAAAPDAPRKNFKRDILPVLKAHFETVRQHAKKIKTKHVCLAVAALVIILRPWLVVGVLLTLLMVFAITYLSLGPERFGEIIKARWLLFKKRKPEKAEQYFKKATELTEQYNAKIAKLPEKFADALTLPDLAELEKEDDRPDPFERLAGQAEEV